MPKSSTNTARKAPTIVAPAWASGISQRILQQLAAQNLPITKAGLTLALTKGFISNKAGAKVRLGKEPIDKLRRRMGLYVKGQKERAAFKVLQAAHWPLKEPEPY